MSVKELFWSQESLTNLEPHGCFFKRLDLAEWTIVHNDMELFVFLVIDNFEKTDYIRVFESFLDVNLSDKVKLAPSVFVHVAFFHLFDSKLLKVAVCLG